MASGARPNILLIYPDQQRYDSLGCSGHPLVQTPHIDRLAREGVRFTHAFTPIPTCCPARQSLMCGKWAERHGGLWNYDLWLPLAPFSEHTWTEDLRKSGYRVGCVGKWHVHPRRGPTEFGFDEWVGKADYARWKETLGIPSGGRRSQETPSIKERSFFGGRDPGPPEHARPHWYAERAVEMIRKYAASGQPWHVQLNFDEPHPPCHPAGRFADMYPPAAIPEWGSFGDDLRDKPYIQRQQIRTWGLEGVAWAEWARYVARYLGMVSQIDDAVGVVLRGLDEMGLAESTLVVYTTDHGDACGSHGMFDKHYIMYDDVVRVPLIVRWPGVAPPASACDAFANNALDLAATLPEAAGLAPPPDCQGRSLLPLLGGEIPSDWPRDAVSTYNGQQFGLYTQRMLRDRRWKLVWNLTDVDELYDLETDPWETRNLAHERESASVLKDLRARLLARLKANGDPAVNSVWMARQLEEGLKIQGHFG